MFHLAFPLINGSRIPIGFTRLPQFQVFLPRGDPNAQYALPLTVQIRDVLGAIQTIDLPPVIVMTVAFDSLLLICNQCSHLGPTR